jgi:hypothetical protein
MSSHHFVKEGQEPALLILEATNYSQAEGMLEWAPMVVVAETALEEVLLWGIKIDVVIARPENEENFKAQLIDQAPIKIISAGEDLLAAALLFLAGVGQNAVSIITRDLTEMLCEKIERVAGKTQVTVRTSTQKWSFIPSGHFKKWFQAGVIVNFSDQGLASTLKARSQSNSGYELTEDQWITIENSVPFWVSEQL